MIVKYPSPSLREKASLVTSQDNLEQLKETLLKGLSESDDGLAIAAPQVGVGKSVFLLSKCFLESVGINLPEMVINPKIVDSSRSIVFDKEGCLSFPGLFISKMRKRMVALEFGLQERTTVHIPDLLLARVVQHEIDHLNGVLLIDGNDIFRLENAVALNEWVRRNAGIT